MVAGGMLRIRRPFALDVIVADAGDPAETQELSDALREAPNLVLSCELVDDPLRW
jgi:hypothetical protein